ncbi:uncharacterized protein L203_100942 [Cryptococcus depauperatus CBS 7841]|uniref:Uncharacterized protein n=1 Tax=Cryptococcus depauperatus CBS 7841 TaxID=1295531 RepID=A0AAJ8JP31_9TREE
MTQANGRKRTSFANISLWLNEEFKIDVNANLSHRHGSCHCHCRLSHFGLTAHHCLFIDGHRHYHDYQVASILEALYTLCLVLRRRSVLAKASNVMSAIAFFTCFTFACIVATTVLRHHDDYCNSSVSNPGDLCGVLRGVEGLGWMLFGLNLIYLFIIPLLVSAGVGGRFFDTLGDLPREHQIENTMGEKAI